MNPRNRNCWSKKTLLALFSLVAVVVLALSGCEQPLQEGETYHKLTSAWPLFDVEKWQGETADGVTWEKEKGDACVWLATWEKEKRYDKNGFLIYRKERSGFFPLWSNRFEETEEYRHKEGNVLFFPYLSHRKKTPVKQ